METICWVLMYSMCGWGQGQTQSKKLIDEKSCVIMNAYVEFVREEIESRNRLVVEGIDG
jgi:hypothetical protein